MLAVVCTSEKTHIEQALACLMWQIGTLGPNGALRQHSAESGVDLSVDGSQPQTSASPPGPAPLVSVVPQEVSTPSATPQDLDSSDERGRQSVASPPVNSLVPSPGPSTGCALPAGLNQPAQQYGSCTTLQGAAPDFQLLWSIPEDPVQPVGGRRYGTPFALHAKPMTHHLFLCFVGIGLLPFISKEN